MGIGAGIVELYRMLARDRFFDGIRNVLEVGSQELQCSGHARGYRALLTQLGKDSRSLEELDSFLAGNPSARDLYENLGLEYAAIDTDRAHGSIFLDLNYDKLPAEFHGKFGMVTNYGTLEHLLNQTNGFEICHVATRPGGYIFHLFPFLGYLDHGFFSFHPNLIYALAAANDYSVEGMWLNLNPAQHEILVPFSVDVIKRLRLDFDTAVALIVLLKKNTDHAFQVPYQPVYAYSLMEPGTERYHFTVNGARMAAKDYLPRQIPLSIVESNIGLLSGRSLLKEVAKRIKRRMVPF
jgi:hypothetical protein